MTKREVKMAGYWPSSLFALLWTETKSRSIKTQKEERGQYPAILTERAWSIKDLLYGIKSTEKKWSSYLFIFELWKGNQLDAKAVERAPISWLDKCRKYNHLIGYTSNSNFQIFKFKTNFCVCRFFLQNVFLKLINIIVFFVFILVEAFYGSIKTEKSQKIFLP